MITTEQQMKASKLVLTWGAIFLAGICSAEVVTGNLRCEYLHNPLGIDAVSPRLSWIITSTRRGEIQTAYQVLVASSQKLMNENKGDLWDSGKVASDESSQIAYLGKRLVSRQDCFWKVRTWDRDGNPGVWSQSAQWQMGLLQSMDWDARWIIANPPASSAAESLIIRHATYGAVVGEGG